MRFGAPRAGRAGAKRMRKWIDKVDYGHREWFFAINIDMPKGGDTSKRQAIAHALLAGAGALPAA